jgi:hypothetical protein
MNPHTRYEIVFEASGTVGQGSANTVDTEGESK